MLRLPDGMRDRLKAQAAANKRTLNGEIIARLEMTLPPDVDYQNHESDKVFFLMKQLKGIHERISALNRDAQYIQGRLLEELQPPDSTPSGS